MEGSKVSELLKQLAAGAIMDTYPMQEVESALEITGTNSQRRRLLPSFIVVYLVILLSFHSEVSVKENLRILLESLKRKYGGRIKTVVDSAITKARGRIKRAPFEHLFNKFVKPIGDEKLKGCYWRQWRVVAADGSSVEIQSTKENIDRFGVHTNQHGEAGYPHLKFVALTESGTRVVFGASIGGEHDGEGALFDKLIEKLDSGMILLADRLYFSFDRWKRCSNRGCALLFRVKDSLNLRAENVFSDGSFTATIKPSNKSLSDKNSRMKVRVIEYEAQFEDGSRSEKIRLITNLLDPEKAPALELAQLYAERWNIETGFDEIKTHLLGKGRVLRSQLPDLVEQEYFGFLLAHFVVRKVMADASRKADISPSELSFTHTVRVIKRKLSGSFPPGAEVEYYV